MNNNYSNKIFNIINFSNNNNININNNYKKNQLMTKKNHHHLNVDLIQYQKKRMPFSIHFFIIAVIFMIFDVEIALLMPMIMTMKQTIMIKWMNTSIVFMLLLTMGLYHEWYNGMISWTK